MRLHYIQVIQIPTVLGGLRGNEYKSGIVGKSKKIY